jgi:cyclopropane-fatty-acyl-phospholipid synthase
MEPVLRAIDRGLREGGIDATLPDGSTLVLGGRAPGPRPVVHLHSWKALVRLVTSGSAGWYRAWAAGEWSSPDPVPLFDLFMRNGKTLGQVARAKGASRLAHRALHALRSNTIARARQNILAHYDLGNEFYAAWLDQSMTYSSAVFADPDAPDEPLEAAQARKIRLLLDRLDLRPGQSLFEIGSGWGSLAEIAARDYGVSVTGLTLSDAQKSMADSRLSGLDARILLQDYRDARGQYDALVSVEMVEAVGQEYWPAYLGGVAGLLKPGGRAAIQLISIDHGLFDAYASSADFIQAYIFPGGMLIDEPRFKALADAAGLRWEDRRGYGPHYAETLRRWRVRFDQVVAEGRLPDGFDRRFVDLWRYYLMYSEGGFRGGGIDVAQVTLVKV